MIQSHHLHLQWKFKLWMGKFAWGVKAKHCWALSTNYLYSKVCWQHPAMFCLYTFPAHNLNFHWIWRWKWWDRIQAIFLNLFALCKSWKHAISKCFPYIIRYLHKPGCINIALILTAKVLLLCQIMKCQLFRQIIAVMKT